MAHILPEVEWALLLILGLAGLARTRRAPKERARASRYVFWASLLLVIRALLVKLSRFAPLDQYYADAAGGVLLTAVIVILFAAAFAAPGRNGRDGG